MNREGSCMLHNAEQKELLYKTLMDYVAEQNKGTNAKISVSFLEELTGMSLHETDVIKNNTQYSDQFKHLTASYGFDNFYDLYLHALSDDGMENRVEKNKDFTSLNKVKRTVIRNGQRTTMTFYEKPKRQDNKTKARANRKQGNDRSKPNGQEAEALQVVSLGGVEEPIPISDLLFVKSIENRFNVLQGSLDNTGIILFLVDEQNIKAIIGMNNTKQHLSLSYLAQDGTVANLYIRTILEIIKYAVKEGLGFVEPKNETKEQEWLMDALEFPIGEQETYIADSEELLDLFGDLP